MANTLSDVGRSTPLAEVIRRVLEGKGGSSTLEELTVHVLDIWGRDLPGTPFADEALIYRMATRVLSCRVSYEEVGGRPPVVEAYSEELEPRPLSPRMSFEDLNRLADTLLRVRVQLPEQACPPAQAVDLSPAPAAPEEPGASRARRKKQP